MKHGFIDVHYDGGFVVPSVVFGCGSVSITALPFNPSIGGAGVAFSPAPPNKKIGEEVLSPDVGEPGTPMGIQHQLIFTHPDSIDVLIEGLLEAKQYLIDK